MMEIRRVLAGVVMFLTSGSMLWAQEETATVDFDLQANLIIVEVSVNGALKQFILDTGASRTTIATALVNELGIEEVEKTKARGVGGEVDASIVRIDSIGVGGIFLHDFSCGVADFNAIGRAMGGDMSGVLGYDFLSQFVITIKYQERQVIFEKYKSATLETAVVQGDTFVSPKFRFQLVRPNPSWQFVTETPLPDIPVIMERTNTSGSVRVQVQEMQGMTLDDIAPLIESSIIVKVENFKKLSLEKKADLENEYYVMSYTGKKDGKDLQLKHVVFKVDEFVYSIYCSAGTSEFAALAGEFDRILQSITFE